MLVLCSQQWVNENLIFVVEIRRLSAIEMADVFEALSQICHCFLIRKKINMSECLISAWPNLHFNWLYWQISRLQKFYWLKFLKKSCSQSVFVKTFLH